MNRQMQAGALRLFPRYPTSFCEEAMSYSIFLQSRKITDACPEDVARTKWQAVPSHSHLAQPVAQSRGMESASDSMEVLADVRSSRSRFFLVSSKTCFRALAVALPFLIGFRRGKKNVGILMLQRLSP